MIDRELWRLSLIDQAFAEMYPDFSTSHGPDRYASLEEQYELRRRQSAIDAHKRYRSYADGKE